VRGRREAGQVAAGRSAYPRADRRLLQAGVDAGGLRDARQPRGAKRELQRPHAHPRQRDPRPRLSYRKIARHLVFASEAKQSSAEAGALDCFVAEPVIGPATSGRTRWLLAMTGPMLRPLSMVGALLLP